MPTLVVVRGPDQGRRFPVVGDRVGVGRHSSNAVHLHDTQISRRHLELRSAGGGYQLVDLGSGNGTLVNGLPAAGPHDLVPGDEIRAGESVLVFAADAPPPAVAVTAGEPPGVMRSIPAEDARRLFADPDRAGTDWLRTRLAVLYEAANVVSHVLDVDELLGRILDLLLNAADADNGCFMLTDADTGELMPKAARSRKPGDEFAVSRTIADYVMKAGRGVLVADAAADDRFAGGESIARHQIRDVICVPARGRHGTVGVLFLDTLGAGVGRFSDDHLHLAVAVAHQAALAVEETRYYQALVNAERLAAVGQTIAAMSHHIKNIMHGVRFGGDMVRAALAGADDDLLRKGWKLVEKNQAKIDDLILDMLSYSKERESAAEPTDLAELVDDVFDVVRGRAADAGVTLELKPAPGLPKVPCDPDGLHRALLNVVGNAVDAAGEGGRVSVELRITADGDWAEATVADTGGGVPEDKTEDIFKPFVSTKGARGTGLGLPVSRKILREHGGDLVAEPGPGGRFVLRLPAN